MPFRSGLTVCLTIEGSASCSQKSSINAPALFTNLNCTDPPAASPVTDRRQSDRSSTTAASFRMLMLVITSVGCADYMAVLRFVIIPDGNGRYEEMRSFERERYFMKTINAVVHS